MNEPSVAVNWAARPVLERQSSPASLSCSPWLTSGREENEETGKIKCFDENQETFIFKSGSHIKGFIRKPAVTRSVQSHLKRSH